MNANHIEAQVAALREDIDQLRVCQAIIRATLEELAGLFDDMGNLLRGGAALLLEDETPADALGLADRIARLRRHREDLREP